MSSFKPVPGDGNCFFHAVSFQLLKLFKGINGQSIQNGLRALRISWKQSLATIAVVLRQRVVDKWQEPFIDDCQQFFDDAEIDVCTEASLGRRNAISNSECFPVTNDAHYFWTKNAHSDSNSAKYHL